MLEARNLSKSFDNFCALSDVSFRVEKGEVVGFLGPNGAGKTTTLRILAGYLGATSGTVLIDGLALHEHPRRAREKLGYMPENSPLYPEMRVTEYLRFRAELKGIRRKERHHEVTRVAERTHILDVLSVPIGHLSKGYRQRVGLADALLNSPPLLVLDEPTSGLDPNQIREVRQLIRTLGKEHAVLLSTHILSEVEAICSRALLISKGRLVAQGPIMDLKSLRSGDGISLVVRGEKAEVERALATIRHIKLGRAELEPLGEGVLRVQVSLGEGDEGAAIERIVDALVHEGIRIREVFRKQASLEEVFAELTRERREDPK